MNIDENKILKLNLLAKAKEKYPKQETRALAKARFLLSITPFDSPDLKEEVFWNELEEQMKQNQIHH